jgi:hypothetical protein
LFLSSHFLNEQVKRDDRPHAVRGEEKAVWRSDRAQGEQWA